MTTRTEQLVALNSENDQQARPGDASAVLTQAIGAAQAFNANVSAAIANIGNAKAEAMSAIQDKIYATIRLIDGRVNNAINAANNLQSKPEVDPCRTEAGMIEGPC